MEDKKERVLHQRVINQLKESLEGLSLAESLKQMSKLFPKGVKFSTAFGREGQVILDTIFRNRIDIEVFTIDTGRLFQETYDVIDKTRARYNMPIMVYYPNTHQVEELTAKKGFHSFYHSVENRKECCFIRKVEPLRRALYSADVWVTGLRAGQSENRQSFEVLEWEEANYVIKFNPILNWSLEEVKAYLEENKVPTNQLFEKGFASIGCAPCTRAVQPGEDARAGRWWWEESQKECGLHQEKRRKVVSA